jgi:hypothetical protein
MTVPPQPRCPYCNATTHSWMCCPRVKRFEFDTSTNPSTLKAVEFHPPTIDVQPSPTQEGES